MPSFHYFVALLSLAQCATDGHLELNGFVSYPGLTPASNVTGYVLLDHNQGTVTIQYKLAGVDPTCVDNSTAANSCGLHIHAGFSCEAASLVLGHYWETVQYPVDPWASTVFVSDANGFAKGSVTVAYGYDVEATKGRVVVVHDRTGARVACGVLPATTDSVTLGALAPYPGYSGTFNSTAGSIMLNFRGTSVAVTYNLTGTDPRCTTPNASTANSCGVHIHVGNTCSNASAVGGHYYDANYKPGSHLPNFTDPWLTAPYIAAADGSAVGVVNVDYGYGFSTSAGRAFVVHDYDGARIACTLIPTTSPNTTTTLPALAPYPGYNGTAITGSVVIDFRGWGAKITYTLQGTESMCNGSLGDQANSCGVHIHSGACDNAGGHYYDSTLFKVDPWAVTSYTSQATAGSLIVSYGYGFEQSKGRAVVVHSYSGARVACSNIPTSPDTPGHWITPKAAKGKKAKKNFGAKGKVGKVGR